MGLSVKAGTFAAGTTSITGVGFQGKVVLFFSSILSTPDIDFSGAVAHRVSGAASSTTKQFVLGSFCDPVAGISVASVFSTTKCIVAGFNESGGITSSAAFNGFTSDGFNLTWSGTAGEELYGYLILGGTDVTAEVGHFRTNPTPGGGGTPSNKSVTLTGAFQPSGALFFASSVTTLDAADGIASWSMGVAQDASTRWYQSCSANGSDFATGINTTGVGVVGDLSQSAGRITINLASFDSSGFTISHSNQATELLSEYYVGFVAIAGIAVRVNSFALGTGTQSITNAATAPKAIITVGSLNTEAGITTFSAASHIGVTDGTTKMAFAAHADSTSSGSRHELSGATAGVIAPIYSDGTLDGRARLTGLTSTGFDLSWTSNPESGYLFEYVAFGVSNINVTAAGFSDKDVAGLPAGAAALTPLAPPPDDRFASAASHVFALANALIDGDRAGQTSGAAASIESGVVDGDRPGATVGSATGHGAGAADGDTFGSGTTALPTHGAGFSDPDVVSPVAGSPVGAPAPLRDGDAAAVLVAALVTQGLGSLGQTIFAPAIVVGGVLASALADNDAPGALIGAGGYIPVGLVDADFFGTAASHGFVLAIAHVDGDRGGVAAGAAVGVQAGASDSDRPGSLAGGGAVTPAGITNEDIAGVPRAAGSGAALALADGDQFGTPSVATTYLLLARADADSIGLARAAAGVAPAALAQGSTAGAPMAGVAGATAGMAEADLFGAPSTSAGAVPAGFLDGDLIGRALASAQATTSGSLDPDVATVLRSALGAVPASLVAVPLFGAEVASVLAAAAGFADGDIIGILVSPRHSLRRITRLRPVKVDVARQRVLLNEGSVERVYDLLYLGVPVDLQEKSGSFTQRDHGLVTQRGLRLYTEADEDIKVGYRIISPTETLEVTHVAIKGRVLEADLERVVAP